MRILRRVLVSVAVTLLVLLLVATGVYFWQQPILLTATGYAAHNACAVTQVADRDDPDSDLPPNPLVPYLRGGPTDDGATVSLLDALAPQRAWHSEGFGCTLAGDRPDLGTATAIGSVGNPFASAPAPEANEALTAALAAAFGDHLSAADRDALGTRGVVIVKDGQIVAERYADGFTAETPQLGWSMTKSVASLLTGVLVQEGVVSLDDDHLRREWTDDRAEITIRDLLAMTSGIEWDETYDLGTPITRMLYLEEDMGGYVATLPQEFAAGAVQEYSSGSTNVLCSVLAERTGLGADLPRQKLLGPLGLSTAVLEADGTGTPVCSSYLWASPRDWAAIGQFALQNGMWNGEQLLPEDWMAQSLALPEKLSDTDDAGFALSWRVNAMPDGSLRWPDVPADAYYASGHDGQRMTIVPSENLVVVRLGFTPKASAGDSITKLVADAIAATGE